MNKGYIVVVIVLFILLSAVFYILHQQMPGFQLGALMGGNILMALLSIGSYVMIMRQFRNNPNAFVRGVFGSTFLKLMICMVAFLIYAFLNRSHIHKPTVYVLCGIYIIYSIPERVYLSKQARIK
jgi:Ca2+/Na+ antiporter